MQGFVKLEHNDKWQYPVVSGRYIILEVPDPDPPILLLDDTWLFDNKYALYGEKEDI